MTYVPSAAREIQNIDPAEAYSKPPLCSPMPSLFVVATIILPVQVVGCERAR